MVITAKEIAAAAKWVEEHVAKVHNGDLPCADISLRTFSGGYVSMRCIVTCEKCNRVPGRAEHRDNYCEVTDYDAV